MRNVIIHSDLRKYFANPVTGANIGLERYGNHTITRFDLDEWKLAWGDPLPEVIDIIDIGYWYVPLGSPEGTVEAYEPPVWHQRGQAA